MKIGSLIKYHRTKLGMTQNELAMGICSIPHLSKIENNSKEANRETLRLLLEKLNIQLQEVKNSEQQIILLLNKLQKHINYLQKDNAVETMERLKEYEELIVFTDLIYLYELYKLRYFVFLNDLELAEFQLNWLNQNVNNFSRDEIFLHSFLSGLVLLLRGKYEEADQELSLLLRNNSDLGAFEGDLYYHLAIVKGRLEESSQAIIYGRKALAIYKDEFNFKRILYTLMSLSLNYTQGKVYDEAIEVYEHLLRNVDLLGQHHLLPQIYHNMGNLYQKKGENANALVYFEKSVLLMSRSNEHYLLCLFNLAYVQYQMNRVKESKKNFLLLKGESKKNKIFGLLAVYYLHLLENNKEKAVEYLEVYLIPYISTKVELKEPHRYFSKLLSQCYLNAGEYEKAVQFIQ